MAARTLAYEVTLHQITCEGCGTVFAIPWHLLRRHTEEGATVRCPNPACPWGGMVPGVSEKAKLEKQLASEQQARRWVEQRLEAEAAEHAKTARKLSRVSAGVCPCCNRTFQNVARHMKTKHPDIAAAPAAKEK